MLLDDIYCPTCAAAAVPAVIVVTTTAAAAASVVAIVVVVAATAAVVSAATVVVVVVAAAAASPIGVDSHSLLCLSPVFRFTLGYYLFRLSTLIELDFYIFLSRNLIIRNHYHCKCNMGVLVAHLDIPKYSKNTLWTSPPG